MAVRSGGQAPYAPPQTVVGLIHAYRNRPLQTPFTPDVLMRAGVKDSLVPRVTASLRLLDLIDENGNPTAEFEGLRRAAQGEYRARLEAILRSVYAEIFQFFDPVTDDEAKARDIFRHYEPLGQLSRIVRLFIGLCEEAGMIPEGNRRAASPAPAANRTPTPKRKPEMQTRRFTLKREATPAPNGDNAIPPALLGVLSGLPSRERGWTQSERDNFYKAFGSLLDFSIPIRERVPVADADDDPDE